MSGVDNPICKELQRIEAETGESDGDDHCCIHDCKHNGAPAKVCCWCGDMFAADFVRAEHGEYVAK